jgi:hypothetical protein
MAPVCPLDLQLSPTLGNVSSLSDVWTNHWAALPPESSTSRTVAYARGCVVDGDAVYVMGAVQDDARIVQGITP